MRNAVLLSTGLHLSFLLVVIFGVPAFFEPDRYPEVVPVQVIMEAPPKEEPPPPPEKEEPPPPAPQQAALPEPPEPKVEPIPEPKPKKVEKPKPKPKPKPKKVEKPKPKPKPKPKKKDDFAALLKNLAHQSKDNRQKPQEPKKEQVADASNKRTHMTNMELRRVHDMLSQLVIEQITPCWNIPVGAKDIHKMTVGIRIYLNPDGSLRGIPRVENTDRARRDGSYRVLAESALRALRNPQCSPLKLPHDKYDIWQEISFNFDPREATK